MQDTIEMKAELLTLMSQQQDTLKEMLKDCPEVKNSTRDDLLQDFYMFIYDKNYKLLSVKDMFPNGKFNRGLIFTVLRNFVFGEIRKDVAKGLRKSEAYATWKEAKLKEGDPRENMLASESNLIILDELKKDLTDDEYEGIVDLVERTLLSKYTDEDGNRDMVAYGKRYRGLYKKYKEIKEKSSLFKYMTPEEVDDFEEFSTLKLNINN